MNHVRVRRTAIAVVAVGLVSGILGLSAAADPGISVDQQALIVNTGGDGVNVRAEPSSDAGIISTLPEGWVVTIVDGPVDGEDGASWFDVTTDTDDGVVSGWVHSAYLTGTSNDDTADQSAQAFVSAEGDGLNLRTAPSISADVTLTIPDGASVEVLAVGIEDADGVVWSQVRYDGAVGYSAESYLRDSPAASEADAASDNAGAPTELAIGGSATVAETDGAGLSVRVSPDAGSPSLTGVEEGSTVQVLDGPSVDETGGVWYQVDAQGIVGWVHGAYLTPDADTTVVAAAAYDPGSVLVSAALEYLDTPYLWGGSTPEGFDCSGFAYFIANGVLGNDFPRELERQVLTGSSVSIDALQPGDLVFFENTYKPGLSHVGFYIGNGQFVSATGRLDLVGIQDMSDPYWSSRYLTARRIVG